MDHALKPRHQSYGRCLPNSDIASLPGKLIVIEGADGSGRSTQIALLRDWMEENGHATVEVGIKRSSLVGQDIEEAMRGGGHTLGPITMCLFYATDFVDQLEHTIVPALRSGFIVLADRYIYTLMARALVRGASLEWLRAVYGMAIVPDAVFYLEVDHRILAERSFRKRGTLDYWESGLDIRREGNLYENFIRYQGELQRAFERLQQIYRFEAVDGNRSPDMIMKELQKKIMPIMNMNLRADAKA
jgi:dTMP kinase